MIIQNPDYVDIVSNLILASKYLVIFTGAGISTESGLSDFRGKNGVWTRRDKGLPPARSKHFDEVQPNEGHNFIVQLQEMDLLKFLISQNVDNLHLKSGIQPERIAELHGNYTIMKCFECDNRYSREEIEWDREIHGRGFRTESQQDNQPLCPECQGRIITSVVNFNDPMPPNEMEQAREHTLRCDLMIVIGSSLVVTPAANFPKIAKGKGAKLIIINIDSTPLDNLADIKLDVNAGDFLSNVLKRIKNIKEIEPI